MNALQHYRSILVTALAAYFTYLVILIQVDNYNKQILELRSEANFKRKRVRDVLMSNLRNFEESHNVLRMSPDAFQRLCSILRGTSRLRDNQYSCVEKQVVKFLHVLSQNVRNRLIRFYFGRSLGTISSHFHRVLRALISLEDRFLLQPTDECPIPSEILLKEGKFYPYFEKCIGAIDGTHIRVKVSRNEAKRYRSRKQFPTQNNLVACSFDLKFTYVLAGWEGSAHDSTVLQDALNREDRLKIPQGRYYLADVGYALTPSFITPYRGVRYHLKEYSNHSPENQHELFNLRHSSLRNAVERCIGILKKRFPIIASGSEPYYNEKTVSAIFIACCILHNFLMGVDPHDALLAEVDNELMHGELESNTPLVSRNETHRQGQIIRNSIAMDMWRDYDINAR
ncbi:nuclease [Rhynchospora pubera]|uniref:Nuclease n=1 Tax=Rhynchospora pubera TaxID=906938 RepID=A0AAV8DQD3_9POAL|nr:nuclease [Rhynchospora pubera]